MQVKVNTWRGERVMELEQALTPSGEYEGGVAERAQSDATTALACVGRLAAALVEKGVLSVQEAGTAMGIHDIEVM